MQVVLCLALLAVPADYDNIIRDARRMFLDTSGSRTLETRLNDEFTKLAEACRLDDARWEAYYERGANRAKRAFFAHSEAEDFLSYTRARGGSPAQQEAIRAGAREFLDACLADAHDNYAKAFERMRKRGETDGDRLLLANATLKFAAREYLEAKRGQPGAIADFKKLLRRNFNKAFCKDHIALCYLDLGYQEFSAEKFPEAQAYWEEALKWSASPWLRDLVMTNQAGAFEMDNEFGRAEAVLREQIQREPYRAVHRKNLGLVVGFQNRLKEALHHYRMARDLSHRTRSAEFFGKWHGNAWLRAAMIHGKLLENDGDARLAWRLFIEYRQMFGDDYNFSVAFADFAATCGQYDLAWTYYSHAGKLQPFCVIPFLGLVEVAPRLSGAGEVVEKRMEEAEAQLEKVRARYELRSETPAVKRICAGMRDRGDGGRIGPDLKMVRLDPDPLAGATAKAIPAWLADVAAKRDPFTPWTPPADDDLPGAPVVEEGEAGDGNPSSRRWSIGLAAALLLGIALFVFGRRR